MSTTLNGLLAIFLTMTNAMSAESNTRASTPADAPKGASESKDSRVALDDQLYSISHSSRSPQTMANEVTKCLRQHSPAEIERLMEVSRSNQDTHIFDVLDQLSVRGAHEDALAVVDEVDRLVPNSTMHSEVVASRAKLLLRLQRVDDARSVLTASTSSECHRGSEVCAWISAGTIPKATTVAEIAESAVFDERGKACIDSYDTDQIYSFSAIDLIEGRDGVRAAARSQLVEMWPNLLDGCPRWDAKQRIARLLGLGWTADELRAELKQAQKGLESDPRQVSLLGATLKIPGRQCNFSADPTCTTDHVPVDGNTALRMLERLRQLSPAWTANPSKSEKVPGDNLAVAEKLLVAYEKELEAAGKLEPADGLARMRAIISRPAYQNLGVMLSSYYLDVALSSWSKSGYALQALDTYRYLLEVGGPSLKSNVESMTAIALLELRAGDRNGALEMLEQRYTARPDQQTAKVIGQIRAAIAGANLAATYPPGVVKRPWTYTDGEPICDFFDIDALRRVDLIDLIDAFNGEREAAFWSLAQDWPSVVSHCYNHEVWDDTRLRLKAVLGDAGFQAAKMKALDSIVLGPDAHFEFAGYRLPLPDLDQATSKGGDPPLAAELTRLRAEALIRRSLLLEDPKPAR